MKNKRRKIKSTFKLWGEHYLPWNLKTGAHLEKNIYVAFEIADLSTGTLKITGCDNSQEVTGITPLGELMLFKP